MSYSEEANCNKPSEAKSRHRTGFYLDDAGATYITFLIA